VGHRGIGVLAGITGGLGNALVTASPSFRGTLGLTAEEAAWIPAAYVADQCLLQPAAGAFRQQFGCFVVRLVLVCCADRSSICCAWILGQPRWSVR
jgi:hypothetical protein